MIVIISWNNLQLYNRECYSKALLDFSIMTTGFFFFKSTLVKHTGMQHVNTGHVSILSLISTIFTTIPIKRSVTIVSCIMVTKLLGEKEAQLTNRNDVVDSVGDGPTETTAETTTKKKAWESFKSSVNIHATYYQNLPWLL